MKDILKTVDGLPLIAKIILAFPCLDIFWNIIRLIRSLDKNNMVGAVLAAVVLIVGVPFVWVIDLVCLILKGNIWWLD